MAVPKNSRNLEFTAECGSQPPATPVFCRANRPRRVYGRGSGCASYGHRRLGGRLSPTSGACAPPKSAPMYENRILAYQLPLLWEISAILA